MDFFSFHAQVNQRSKPQGAPAAPAGAEPLTVSQLTSRIDAALRSQLPASLNVRGEISNFNVHRTSGHTYFTLKDANACIDCVIFKSDNIRLKFTPQDGLEVLATGNVRVYRDKGKYQLYVSRLEPIGQGALELAFRQLHAKLEKEGLFAEERKKPIPEYPQRIVLLTSTQTAAFADMLKVLRRFPWLDLRVCHVPVQGDGSAEKIAAALQDLNRCAADLGGIDVILMARGGGSLEDLWEFNEECVARAIAISDIPIITGIGHEIDVSIADLVADHHAHTPTEAAQVATRNWRTARETLEGMNLELRRQMRQLLQQAWQRLANIERHEMFRRPLDRINAARQRIDDRQRALTLALTNRVRQFHDRIHRAAAMLGERHPRHAIRLQRQRLDALSLRLHRSIRENLLRSRQRVLSLSQLLEAVGPEQVLRRGYSITTVKKGGAVVRSASQVRPGDRLVTRFADGTVETRVEDTKQLSLFD